MDEMSDVFAGEPQRVIPTLADRYSYKKMAGSSDTSHQRDEIVT